MTVTVNRQGRVLVIRMERDAKRNAIDSEMTRCIVPAARCW